MFLATSYPFSNSISTIETESVGSYRTSGGPVFAARFSFNPLLEPHPECPDCGGDGVSRPVIKDTRRLSPQGRALFAGAKQGKHGIEIQMHSKLDALEKLAKHFGLYAKDNHQRSDPLALREMGDAERAVRLTHMLNGSPATVDALVALMAGKGAA